MMGQNDDDDDGDDGDGDGDGDNDNEEKKDDINDVSGEGSSRARWPGYRHH